MSESHMIISTSIPLQQPAWYLVSDTGWHGLVDGAETQNYGISIGTADLMLLDLLVGSSHIYSEIIVRVFANQCMYIPSVEFQRHSSSLQNIDGLHLEFIQSRVPDWQIVNQAYDQAQGTI